MWKAGFEGRSLLCNKTSLQLITFNSVLNTTNPSMPFKHYLTEISPLLILPNLYILKYGLSYLSQKDMS